MTEEAGTSCRSNPLTTYISMSAMQNTPMYYWWKAYGFKPVAYSGLESGNRAFAS